MEICWWTLISLFIDAKNYFWVLQQLKKRKKNPTKLLQNWGNVFLKTSDQTKCSLLLLHSNIISSNFKNQSDMLNKMEQKEDQTKSEFCQEIYIYIYIYIHTHKEAKQKININNMVEDKKELIGKLLLCWLLVYHCSIISLNFSLKNRSHWNDRKRAVSVIVQLPPLIVVLWNMKYLNESLIRPY